MDIGSIKNWDMEKEMFFSKGNIELQYPIHQNLGFTKKIPGPAHWHRNGSMRDATRPHLDPGHVGHLKMGNDDEPDVGLMILYILYILYSDNIKQAHIIS